MSASDEFPRDFDIAVGASNAPAPQIVIPNPTNVIYVVTAVNVNVATNGLAYTSPVNIGVFTIGNFMLPATAGENAIVGWQGKIIANGTTIFISTTPVPAGVTAYLEVQGYVF